MRIFNHWPDHSLKSPAQNNKNSILNRQLPVSDVMAKITFEVTKYLSVGSTMYLSLAHVVPMPPNQIWYCRITLPTFFTATLCSALFVLSMTFDRFYSIIRPHKAASFNTIKRTKITIICIFIFSIIFNIPHWFTTFNIGWLCLPVGNKMVMAKSYSQFYYWASFVLQFAFPFVSLLMMNSVIIHTLRNRKVSKGDKSCDEGPNKRQGKSFKIKNSEKQVFAILLLETFGFLILTTPGYLFFILNLFVNFMVSPKVFAAYHLFSNVAQKLHFTNQGINFFFYVISGQKFRTDLQQLFRRPQSKAHAIFFAGSSESAY